MHLTRSEQEIMELFWSVDHPITQAQVVETCENRSWKERSVFSMLNSLMKKGLIHEVSFVRSGKTYARTFEASMTQAEFLAKTVFDQLPPEDMPALFCALLHKDATNEQNLEKVKSIIESMKENG